MNIKVRIARSLFDTVRVDLARPHPFAAERVGFLFGQLVDADGPLVLLKEYAILPDEGYINDPKAGARIDSHTIRWVMQGVLDRKLGAFHIHMHHWPGRPVMSHMDAVEIPRIVKGLCRVGPDLVNGIILLHQEECGAWVWMPGKEAPVEVDSVSVVGFPYHFSWRQEL